MINPKKRGESIYISDLRNAHVWCTTVHKWATSVEMVLCIQINFLKSKYSLTLDKGIQTNIKFKDRMLIAYIIG